MLLLNLLYCDCLWSRFSVETSDQQSCWRIINLPGTGDLLWHSERPCQVCSWLSLFLSQTHSLHLCGLLRLQSSTCQHKLNFRRSIRVFWPIWTHQSLPFDISFFWSFLVIPDYKLKSNVLLKTAKIHLISISYGMSKNKCFLTEIRRVSHYNIITSLIKTKDQRIKVL